MKKLLLLLFFSGCVKIASAQDTTSTFTVPPSGPTKLATIASAEDLFIISLSSDNWSGLPSTITAKPFRSRGLSFLLMKEAIGPAGHFGIGYGLGFSSQNVHTDADLFYDEVSGKSTLEKIPDSVDYTINKISLNFIDAALELRFRTSEDSKDNSFKLSAGIKGGVLVQSHIKYEGPEGKYKTYGIKNLNHFQYGLTGRIGYGAIAVSGYYSLVDVFKKDKGPVLTPYSIAITFTF